MALQTAPIEEIRKAAARICRDYLTGEWKSITAEEIIVKRISGGLSNFLYYVSLPEIAPTTNSNNNNNNNNNSITSTTNVVCDNTILNKNINKINNNNNFCNNELSSSSSSSRDKINRLNASLVSDNSNKRLRTDSGGAGAYCGSNDEPREVLLRIYGQTHGENALETMISESVVFALLSERNFGPKLHGIFPGGRIEQYIPARPLLTNELSDHRISMKIAEKMGDIHSLNLPMSKEPDWLWNCMKRWLKSLDSVLQNVSAKDKKAEMDIIKSMDFWAEAKWLKSIIDTTDFPVLFCHNDLQEGNILMRESAENSMKLTQPKGSSSSLGSNFDDSSIISSEEAKSDMEPNREAVIRRSGSRKRPSQFDVDVHSKDLDNSQDSLLSNTSLEDSEPDLIIIDFEYCAYNYRGFDLANHFLEWTLDYSNPAYPFYHHRIRQYPTSQQRHDFIVTYLKKLNETNYSSVSYTPSLEEIQNVEEEIKVFSMFSHLFWSLWSAVNISSTIEFGYLDYAIARINQYNILKKEFVLSKN